MKTRMMRNALALLVLATVITLLSACGGIPGDTTSPDEELTSFLAISSLTEKDCVFTQNLCGLTAVTQKQTDTAEWKTNGTHGLACVELSGTDSDNADNTPNASLSGKFLISAQDKWLSLRLVTKNGEASKFRVRANYISQGKVVSESLTCNALSDKDENGYYIVDGSVQNRLAFSVSAYVDKEVIFTVLQSRRCD